MRILRIKYNIKFGEKEIEKKKGKNIAMIMPMNSTMVMDMSMDCPMPSTFQWTVNVCLLFEPWHVKHGWQYSICLIVIVLVCIFREYLQLFSAQFPNCLESLFGKLGNKKTEERFIKKDIEESYDYDPSLHNESINNRTSKQKKDIWMCFSPQIEEGVLKTIQDGIVFVTVLFIDYCIMLLLMSYNYGIAITILASLCAGRFLGQFGCELMLSLFLINLFFVIFLVNALSVVICHDDICGLCCVYPIKFSCSTEHFFTFCSNSETNSKALTKVSSQVFYQKVPCTGVGEKKLVALLLFFCDVLLIAVQNYTIKDGAQ
ncbi:hypothetical protein RFI_12832 [Reticulomyxa filosa]|uniref:Copper transport protein n=1 Tax=Reticulomyxa filosa TaxID=46433 RepID=X6NED4_RETFI|nr:hypothetical protein RFI_12832 [Reticulomyxa filosa]|eukprot:ETO24326.1 hypothetical protein RFI_12832 [Reticulomyxa filosa]